MAHLNPISGRVRRALRCRVDPGELRADARRRAGRVPHRSPRLEPPAGAPLRRRRGEARLALGGSGRAVVPTKRKVQWILQCQRIAAEHGVATTASVRPTGRGTLETVRRFTTVDSTSRNRGTRCGTAPLVVGHEIKVFNVKEGSEILALLTKDHDLRPQAITTSSSGQQEEGQGAPITCTPCPGTPTSRWVEVNRHPRLPGDPRDPMFTALYDTIVKPPQPEGATASPSTSPC